MDFFHSPQENTTSKLQKTLAEKQEITFHIRVTPKSRGNIGIFDAKTLADGKIIFPIRIHEPAEKGKANTAVQKLLAKFFDVRHENVQIWGETFRTKRIKIIKND